MPRADEIVAIVIVASFAAGLNVYATVATLGLLGHFQVVQFPHALHLLTAWPVIIAAAALFLLEMFADKIPVLDIFWNIGQTFVRVPVAALISYGATAQMSPAARLIATAAGAAIAFAAHGSKTAIRAGITASPEPLSNIALSAGEDALAIGLTWFATAHPFIAATIVALLLVMSALFIRALVRGLRRVFRRRKQPTPPAPAAASPPAPSADQEKLARLAAAEQSGEKAYDEMYEAHSDSHAMACYSEAKESFYDAIRRAEELGMSEKAEQLRARLEHIKNVYRHQFSR